MLGFERASKWQGIKVHIVGWEFCSPIILYIYNIQKHIQEINVFSVQSLYSFICIRLVDCPKMLMATCFSHYLIHSWHPSSLKENAKGVEVCGIEKWFWHLLMEWIDAFLLLLWLCVIVFGVHQGVMFIGQTIYGLCRAMLSVNRNIFLGTFGEIQSNIF